VSVRGPKNGVRAARRVKISGAPAGEGKGRKRTAENLEKRKKQQCPANKSVPVVKGPSHPTGKKKVG
jgi:hypothetical protein